MALDALKEALPAYAKDLKLNLGSVISTSQLSEQQVWGAVLAVAMATRSPRVLAELEPEARERLSPEAYTAAKAAAAIMAMNNVYYRALHLIGDEQYSQLPARLRMTVIGNPGVDKADFELWCLAVSAVNGCGRCLESHEKVLREQGLPREHIQEALRIAAVINAVAATLEAEGALATL
ncbi:alkyl hydroperoxide reductase [Carbonactinospora thermoautotrophica]|uniref:Alkyl hydroperoxide reductase AhpD n=1 Tax=Carbonactinospora thermoautotrophica TaxID=1469144 RepID=A0A132NB43_9ACTN|nr:carboxymuconolactone decarboxylase family protein [Carbonactinospora thermoautotrophica]KWW99227.1 Alkyl hydroperoxide reductase AhpD [Carbonactinospora thermoautotrophica]KWX05004.1 alkyl hydroperoxide reductase [Carbonactinospora thermoautotrophica]KWX07328.1 alkyl hydroperoxide reductase [Carbonactinospora thermoautotrophica]MCX9191571.1 alkyl hydroperoxide reductase [Carbonactinospora thermoautotrophica]